MTAHAIPGIQRLIYASILLAKLTRSQVNAKSGIDARKVDPKLDTLLSRVVGFDVLESTIFSLLLHLSKVLPRNLDWSHFHSSEVDSTEKYSAIASKSTVAMLPNKLGCAPMSLAVAKKLTDPPTYEAAKHPVAALASSMLPNQFRRSAQ